MVGTVIAPSLTEISTHLGFAQNPGWLITLPSLGVVLFAPFAGKLIDRKGSYAMITWGLIPYATFGVLGIVLRNPYLVIADRLLLGAATALIQASATGLIAQLFKGGQRLKLIAWQGMSIELGGVFFLSIGGFLGERQWYYPFFIYLMALLCLALITFFVPTTKKAISAPTESNPQPVSTNILRVVLSAALAMTLFFVVFVGLPVYLPTDFQFIESEIGYFMALISMLAVLSASQLPKVVLWLGEAPTIVLGFIFFALGLLIFSLTFQTYVLFIGATCMGIGFGCTIPLLNHMTLQESNLHNRGKNLGYYSMGVFAGQFFSSFVTLLFTDIRYSFQVSALLAFLVAASLLLIHITRNKALKAQS